MNHRQAHAAIPHAPGVTRRRFLTCATAALSLPCLIPARVLSAAGQPGANDRLTVAHMGVGGMGTAHLKNMKLFREDGLVNIAAVCDVDEKRLERAVAEVGPGVSPYRDYRHVLERKDVDAVVIATPDHWHPVQCIHACESGKHVFVEKPASVALTDGRAMVNTARRCNRMIQVGAQGRSARPAHAACTFIRNGMLGKVHTVTCWHSLNPVGGTEPDSAPPPELDWDLWLGPLPWRPFNKAYLPGTFRWLMESGGGVIRDRGAHVFSVIRWCLDADDQHPVTIEATGTPPPKGIWDCPPEMKVVFTFKNPDWQLVWEQPGDKRGREDFGIVFYGDKDFLIVSRDGTQVDPMKKAHEFKVPPGGVVIPQINKHADYNLNHKEDWFRAIKTGQRPLMDIEPAHRSSTLCILGNLSYVLGRTLTWDAANERVVGDEQANRLLSCPQRYPYCI
jgi:predicted dehydrogenase